MLSENVKPNSLTPGERSERGKNYKYLCVEVAYFTLSENQLYVNLDKLLEGPKAILPPPPYKIIGGLAPAAPPPPPPVPTPMYSSIPHLKYMLPV